MMLFLVFSIVCFASTSFVSFCSSCSKVRILFEKPNDSSKIESSVLFIFLIDDKRDFIS